MTGILIEQNFIFIHLFCLLGGSRLTKRYVTLNAFTVQTDYLTE